MKTDGHCGFTLLEMLLVLTIAGALSLGGILGWQRWQQRQQLEDSARQVQQVLLRLRSDANWRNSTRLVGGLQGERWCLSSLPLAESCRSASAYCLLAPWPEVRLREVTRGMGFYGKNNTAYPGHIVLVSPAGERRIIVSARGRVRICARHESACQ